MKRTEAIRCMSIAGILSLSLGIAHAQVVLPPVGGVWYVAVDGDDVNGDGSLENPFATVATGLAACTMGDTLIIGEGTYQESNLNVTVPVTVRGTDQDAPPLIDAGGDAFCFDIGSGLNPVVLECLLLAGGTEAAVRVGADSQLVLDHCQLDGGPATGIGVHLLLHAHLEMTGGCINDRGGDAIHSYYASCTVAGADFMGNAGGYRQYHGMGGGGVAFVECDFESNGFIMDFVTPRNERDSAIAPGQREVLVRDCTFRNNGGISAESHWLNIADCLFESNHGYWFGLVSAFYGGGNVSNCTFLGNEGPIMEVVLSTIVVESTLIAGGTGPCILNPYHGAINLNQVTIAHNDTGILPPLLDYASQSWTNTIIAGNTGQVISPYDYEDIDITATCCDVFGNGGGDWVGLLAVQLGSAGNISADPLFCDAAAGDFTLVDTSPCLPGQHPDGADCGQLGALGQGCCSECELLIVPASPAPMSCGDTRTLAFHYVAAMDVSGIRSYSIRVTATDQVTFDESDFVVATLPPDAEVYYQILEHGPNDYSLDYTILGGDTQGIATEVDLFTVDFHGAADGTAGVTIAAADLRDLVNQSVPVDHSAQATLEVDCLPPEAVTDPVAVPAHQRVDLTWTDPAEPGATSVLVFRGQWQDGAGASAYPLYGQLPDGVVPDRPGSLDAAVADPRWTQIATVETGVESFTDEIVERGIYYYELFTVDQVGNPGPPAAEAASSTNYWLGDVAGGGDGFVSIADISVLGDSYGVHGGEPYFDAVCDIGPTDDSSGTGLPLPDAYVGFDDLVIFGLNFGEVGPAKSEPAPCDHVALAWVENDRGEWVCRLVEPCQGLKAVHVEATLPLETLADVELGDCAARQGAPVFLQNAAPGRVDVGLAILGRGVAFEGAGELFRVSLSTPADLSAAVIDARDLHNEPLQTVLAAEAAGSIPGRFALFQNFPNPFNPSTTIKFELPRPSHVVLAIFGVDGRRVRSLVDDHRDAGRYDAVWNGTDDRGRSVASGTYFYRLVTDRETRTRKLVLMK